MRLAAIALTLAVALAAPPARGAGAEKGPARAAPPAPSVGVAVADYLMRRWPELDATPAACDGPDNCFSLNFATVPASPAPKFWEYTYGVPLAGILKIYQRTHDAKYLDFVKKYVDRYVDASGTISYARPWSVGAGGKAQAPNDPTIQDVIQPSALLFDVYAATHDARYLTAMAHTRAIFPTIKTNGAGAFWHKPAYPDQQWLDGIYMSQPFLARYGAQHADQAKAGDAEACFKIATTQIKLAAEHTFDGKSELYYHAWNAAADGVWRGLSPPTRVPPATGVAVSPVLWSRAIGWYIAGIVDVLEYLPRNHPDRAAVLETLRHIASGLRRYQDPASGLWYQVIDVGKGPLPATGGYAGEADRPAQPNWLETSASAIFAYGLAKGVRLGYLPSRYRIVADKAWRGVKSRIDIGADGTVAIHGTVVGLSVGGTYNAYANADVRTDMKTGDLPAPASCPTSAQIPAGTTPPIACKYIYVRDNVPQGFGAVLLAASEMELEKVRPAR